MLTVSDLMWSLCQRYSLAPEVTNDEHSITASDIPSVKESAIDHSAAPRYYPSVVANKHSSSDNDKRLAQLEQEFAKRAAIYQSQIQQLTLKNAGLSKQLIQLKKTMQEQAEIIEEMHNRIRTSEGRGICDNDPNEFDE